MIIEKEYRELLVAESTRLLNRLKKNKSIIYDN
jgi:hypothetical protein